MSPRSRCVESSFIIIVIFSIHQIILCNVASLDLKVTELFSTVGEVAHVRFATSQEDGSFRGFGHVQFTDGENTTAAISNLQGSVLNGKSLRIDYAPPRDRNSPRSSFGSGRDGGRGGGRGGRGGRRRILNLRTLFIKKLQQFSCMSGSYFYCIDVRTCFWTLQHMTQFLCPFSQLKIPPFHRTRRRQRSWGSRGTQSRR